MGWLRKTRLKTEHVVSQDEKRLAHARKELRLYLQGGRGDYHSYTGRENQITELLDLMETLLPVEQQHFKGSNARTYEARISALKCFLETVRIAAGESAAEITNHHVAMAATPLHAISDVLDMLGGQLRVLNQDVNAPDDLKAGISIARNLTERMQVTMAEAPLLRELPLVIGHLQKQQGQGMDHINTQHPLTSGVVGSHVRRQAIERYLRSEQPKLLGGGQPNLLG